MQAAQSFAGKLHPREPLFGENVKPRGKFLRVVKRTHMNMRFHWQAFALAGERRSANGAKSARCSWGRVECRDRPPRDCHGRFLEGDEDRDRCSAVPAAALAMAPRHPLGLANSPKMYGAAKTPAFAGIVHDRPCLLNSEHPRQGSPRCHVRGGHGISMDTRR